MLSNTMPSAASRHFVNNRADINRLWEIHQDVAGKGVGRKRDVEVLNRSAIVLITACWEAYVEDVAKEGFDFLLANATSHAVIPTRVRTLAAKLLKDDPDESALWQIADDGWRKVIANHRAAVLARWVSRFNTPKTENVTELFATLIGLKDLPKSWVWPGMSARKAAQKLDSYIQIRGAIAHRLKHDKDVYKSWSTDYLSHVVRLVEKTDAVLGTHLEELVGKRPW